MTGGTNDILTEICVHLRGLFPDWRVYAENPRQNLEAPCLIVNRESGAQRERLGNRVRFDELYSVSVICPDDIAGLRAAVEKAELCLRFVPVRDDRPLLTRDRSSQIVDDSQGVITFWISRTVWFEPEPDPLQEILVNNTGAIDMARTKTKAADHSDNHIKYTGSVLAASKALSDDKWIAGVVLDPDKSYTIAEGLDGVAEGKNRKV